MSNETTLVKNKKTVSPELRFKSFKDEWKNAKMSDMITFISGFAFESSKMLTQIGKYQLIKMSNVYKSELQLDRSPSYWDEIDEKHEKVLLRSGDTILTLTGTVGKRDYGYSVIIPENNKFLLNQRLVCLRSKGELTDSGFINGVVKTSHFLYHFFNESKGGTGNQSNVGVEDLRNIRVAFPSLPEQQKIASFLSAVDEKIQQLTRKKELLEQYKKGVMQQLFSGKLRFKDENRKAYPKWEEKRLGDIGKIRMCKRVFNNETSQTGDVPFYKIGTFGKDADAYITLEHYLSFKEKYPFPKVGEILISAAGTLGRTVVYDGRPAYFQDSNIVWIENDEKLVTNSFLYFVYQIVKYDSEGGTIQRLYNNIISSAKFSKPSIEEQQKIASYLTALDAKIESVATQVSKVQEFKKGLLQQMFV